jgi:hypothetical protein
MSSCITTPSHAASPSGPSGRLVRLFLYSPDLERLRDMDVWIRRKVRAGQATPWLVCQACKVYHDLDLLGGPPFNSLTSAERHALLQKRLPGVPPDVIREGLHEFEHSKYCKFAPRQEVVASNGAEAFSETEGRTGALRDGMAKGSVHGQNACHSHG